MRSLAFTVSLLFLISAGGAGPGAASPAAGDWSLRSADGADVSFGGALARGPVLVSFWALWCGPCLKELPHLDALARETGGRLTVLAVNADGPKGVARVRPYLQSHRIGLTVPLDTSGDVARLLQVGGVLPFLVLYDAAGHEVYRHVGYREGDEGALRERVLKLLAAAPRAAPDSSATRRAPADSGATKP